MTCPSILYNCRICSQFGVRMVSLKDYEIGGKIVLSPNSIDGDCGKRTRQSFGQDLERASYFKAFVIKENR